MLNCQRSIQNPDTKCNCSCRCKPFNLHNKDMLTHLLTLCLRAHKFLLTWVSCLTLNFCWLALIRVWLTPHPCKGPVPTQKFRVWITLVLSHTVCCILYTVAILVYDTYINIHTDTISTPDCQTVVYEQVVLPE